jgi:hypothetical protein
MLLGMNRVAAQVSGSSIATALAVLRCDAGQSLDMDGFNS